MRRVQVVRAGTDTAAGSRVVVVELALGFDGVKVRVLESSSVRDERIS